MQTPVIRINRTQPRTNGDSLLSFDIGWRVTGQFGPATDPPWLEGLRVKYERFSLQSGYRTITSARRTELETAWRRLFAPVADETDPVWRTRILAYSKTLAAVDVCPGNVHAFLREYSETATANLFPPVLLLHSDVSDIAWQFVPILDKGAVPGDDLLLQNLWCLRLAIGQAGAACVLSGAPVMSRREVRPEVTIGTRLLHRPDTSGTVQSPDFSPRVKRGRIEDDLINDMRLLTKACDPWGLSASPAATESFGVVVDQIDDPEQLGGMMQGGKPAALIVYHGNIEEASKEEIVCTWPTSSSNQRLTFKLDDLGSRGITLLVAGTESSAATEMPINISLAYKHGATWLGTPVHLREAQALYFARAFLDEACTHGAPVGELLRCALDRAQRSTGDLYPFLLCGDPAVLLQFSHRYEMKMHVTTHEKSIIRDLAERLETNPMIPIAIVKHDEISDMDSEFLRRLEGTTEAEAPEIWPVSLCAIGRALFDERYRDGARKRLFIIQVALSSRGGNRLFLWQQADSERQPMTADNAEQREPPSGPYILGFAHNSFEATLARMYLCWQDGVKHNARTLKADYFASCPLEFKAHALGSTNINGALFWGADFQENALAELPERQRKALQQSLHDSIDLDMEFERTLFAGDMAARKDRIDLPMIFLVVTFGKAKAEVDATSGSSGMGAPPARPAPPPESLFALRELQRAFRGIEPRKTVAWFADKLTAPQPHYFRSVTEDDLNAMAKFVAEALHLGLWEGAIGHGAERKGLEEMVRKELGEHLYLTPDREKIGLDEVAAEVRRFWQSATKEEVDKVIAGLEQIMWGGGRPAPLSVASSALKEQLRIRDRIKERIRQLRDMLDASDPGGMDRYQRVLALADQPSPELDRLPGTMLTKLLEALLTGSAETLDDVFTKALNILELGDRGEPHAGI
jgi:hypothetical protein